MGRSYSLKERPPNEPSARPATCAIRDAEQTLTRVRELETGGRPHTSCRTPAGPSGTARTGRRGVPRHSVLTVPDRPVDAKPGYQRAPTEPGRCPFRWCPRQDSDLRHPLQEVFLGWAVTCENFGCRVSGLGKHPSAVLTCSRGFPASCVLNPFRARIYAACARGWSLSRSRRWEVTVGPEGAQDEVHHMHGSVTAVGAL